MAAPLRAETHVYFKLDYTGEGYTADDTGYGTCVDDKDPDLADELERLDALVSGRGEHDKRLRLSELEGSFPLIARLLDSSTVWPGKNILRYDSVADAINSGTAMSKCFEVDGDA